MKKMKGKEVREESDSSSDTNSSLFRSDGSDYNEPEVEDESVKESYSDESYGAIDKKKCLDNLDEVLSKSKAKSTTKAKGKCPTTKAPTPKATKAKGKRKAKMKLDPMVYVILYLDRLDRAPLQWGVSPRIKVWTRKEMSKAAKEDRTETGDYGRLGCLSVPYGDPHPYEGEDTLPCQRKKRATGDVKQILRDVIRDALLEEDDVESAQIDQEESQRLTKNAKHRRKGTNSNLFVASAKSEVGQGPE